MSLPPGSAACIRAGLSRYLCGTHSGLLALGHVRAAEKRNDRESLAAAHRRFDPVEDGARVLEIGSDRWEAGEQSELADSLDRAFARIPVIDLVFFGSQARGGRTGFSDVDAILVIEDEVAESAARLRELRPRILAAQRAVLAHQPMQHHGFEVMTPKLLLQAGDALALPAVALSETSSLKGAGFDARFRGTPSSGKAFSALSTSLARLRAWPAHPWEAHRHVAMFELLPTLFLQCRNVQAPKWRSFEMTRADFERDWWPYEVLAEVRRVWPRHRRPKLEAAALLARNPWAAVAAWRRLPQSLPVEVQPLLTPRLLKGLHKLVALMGERSRWNSTES